MKKIFFLSMLMFYASACFSPRNLEKLLCENHNEHNYDVLIEELQKINNEIKNYNVFELKEEEESYYCEEEDDDGNVLKTTCKKKYLAINNGQKNVINIEREPYAVNYNVIFQDHKIIFETTIIESIINKEFIIRGKNNLFLYKKNDSHVQCIIVNSVSKEIISKIKEVYQKYLIK